MIGEDKPIRNSYQVESSVYAGEYPGDLRNPAEKVNFFLDFGITHFIDLTEEGELNPYRQYLPASCAHCRFPIKDMSVPKSLDSVYGLMQYLDSVVVNPDNKVYIHCWGGVGRTGVIVGSFYIYRGEPYMQAMNHLRKSFMGCAKSEWRHTPETREQREFIRDFYLYIS